MEGWDNFFLGHVGASAALAGLLFVAISLNLTRILSVPTLPGRALAALSLLIAILVMSSFMLMPRQPAVVLGLEAVLVGLLLTALGLATRRHLAQHKQAAGRAKAAADLLFYGVAVVPYLVGGLVMIFGQLGAGIYFVAVAVILSLIKAVVDAWVLLVEIKR